MRVQQSSRRDFSDLGRIGLETLPVRLQYRGRFLRRESVTIDPPSLHLERSTLLKTERVTFPLTQLGGVVRHVHLDEDGETSASLELRDSASNLFVRLLSSRQGETVAGHWRHCCEQLGLPPIEYLNPCASFPRDFSLPARTALQLLREKRWEMLILPSEQPPEIDISARDNQPVLHLPGGRLLVLLNEGLSVETESGGQPPVTYDCEEIETFTVDRLAGRGRLALFLHQTLKPRREGDGLPRLVPLARGLAEETLIWLQCRLFTHLAERGTRDGQVTKEVFR